MPIPQHKNLLDSLRVMREELLTRTNLTNFDKDSKIRVLSDVFAAESLGLREEQIQIDYANLLSSARGRALDEIGERLGLPRIKADYANSFSTERNIAFYVESGNFGGINSGSPIVIPSGLYKVSTEANSNELGTTIDFNITETVTLAASSALGYATVRAANIGSRSNLGRQTIRTHNFTNYTLSSSQSLKVVNFYPILNGVDDEVDDLYKFRLANHYNRLIQNNETKMKLGALTVPGVVNTRVEPGYFGIGTAAIFALGPENQMNLPLLEGVQERLNAWTSPGGEFIATAATEVQFDFVIEVAPTKPLTSNQINRLKSEINRSFLDYFRKLGLGSVVDMTSLAMSTQQKINTIASFVRKDREQVFKKVYVRKGFSGAATDEKSKLVTSTYVLKPDEFPTLGTLNVSIV